MIDLTLQIAEAAVKAAQGKAKALGSPMTVTVVDEAGRLVLSARGDGTGFLTPDTSRAKATAAAAFRRSTAELTALGAKGFLAGDAGRRPGRGSAHARRRADRRRGPRDRRHRLRRRHRRAGPGVRRCRRGDREGLTRSPHGERPAAEGEGADDDARQLWRA